jgi:hypothetical protein
MSYLTCRASRIACQARSDAAGISMCSTPSAASDAAVRLAAEDHRIDGAAGVVHGGVAHALDHARLGTDFDLAHRAAAGIRRQGHGFITRPVGTAPTTLRAGTH